MDEQAARLALLQAELGAIQDAIRGLDTITFQIKGWSVTVATAISGFAVSPKRPALLALAAVAVLEFWLINAQFKLYQRAFIDRNKSIHREVGGGGLMDSLRGSGPLLITGAPVLSLGGIGPGAKFGGFAREFGLANTCSIHIFLLLGLGIEAILL